MSKFSDHMPLHRQEKIFERQGVRISRKTMGGWLTQVAGLLAPLYQCSKRELFGSKVIGTDDTGVKVLDPTLPFARTGRIWPYLGDAHHPVIVHHGLPILHTIHLLRMDLDNLVQRKEDRVHARRLIRQLLERFAESLVGTWLRLFKLLTTVRLPAWAQQSVAAHQC